MVGHAWQGGMHGKGGVHGGEHVWQGLCMTGAGAYVVGGHAWQGVCMVGVCVAGGCAWQGGMHGKGGMLGREAHMALETATAADGTHRTGMHSCLVKCLVT